MVKKKHITHLTLISSMCVFRKWYEAFLFFFFCFFFCSRNTHEHVGLGFIQSFWPCLDQLLGNVAFCVALMISTDTRGHDQATSMLTSRYSSSLRRSGSWWHTAKPFPIPKYYWLVMCGKMFAVLEFLSTNFCIFKLFKKNVQFFREHI